MIELDRGIGIDQTPGQPARHSIWYQGQCVLSSSESASMAPVESAESDGRRVALSKCSPVCPDQTLCPFKFGKSFPAFQSVVTIQSLIAFKHQQSPGVSKCKIVPVLSPDVSLICLDSNS